MTVPTNVFADVLSATTAGTRRLMVSDNPETINTAILPAATSNGTLWHDIVNTTATSVTHRVFGWHYNTTGTTIKIGLTVQNRTGTNSIRVQNVQRQKRSSNNSAEWTTYVGQCLSKACLGGTMDAWTPVDNAAFSNSVSLVEANDVPHGYLIGFMYDFTVARTAGTGNMSYTIRTVTSRDIGANLRTITSNPFSVQPNHPRGSWAFSETHARVPTYNVGDTRVYRICSSTVLQGTARPADYLFTAAASGSTGSGIDARDNVAQFGVVYRVTIPIYNARGPSTVRIRLNPRGGHYAGAVRRAVGNNPPVTLGIPRLDSASEVVTVTDYAAPTGSSSYSFDLMIAGNSNTPLGIYVTTI